MNIFVIGHQRIILTGVLPIVFEALYDCPSAGEATLKDMGQRTDDIATPK